MRWANENVYDSVILAASQRFGVPVALIKAVIGQESGFNPKAYRAEPAISDASVGLMQILLATARGEGFTGVMGSATGLTGLFDPATNITYGTSYLASCLARTNGNIAAAASAYNGGFRPDIGFGAPATRSVTVCLRRDSNGQCVQTRTVPPGEYANQDYVNRVLNNVGYFESVSNVVPTVIPASPPLTGARSFVESKTVGRAGRTPVGVAVTYALAVLTNTVRKVLQCLRT